MYNILLGILITASIFLMLFQFYPIYRGHKAKGNKIADLKGIVPNTVLTQPRYAIYFWAPQCGMCRSMTPVVNHLMEARDDLASVNAAQHPEAAKELGVMGTPALVLVKNGVIQRVSLGAKTEKGIVQILEP